MRLLELKESGTTNEGDLGPKMGFIYLLNRRVYRKLA